MPSDETIDTAAKGITVLFVIIVFLYAIFIAQQLLLGALTALLGVLVYFAWRTLRNSGRNGDKSLQS